MKRSSLAATSITLKLKDTEFRLCTRTRSGLSPTQLADRLFGHGEPLLREFCDGTPNRLIGIGAGDLCPAEHADRGDLIDQEVAVLARREAALDTVRARFGPEAVQRGLAFKPRA